MIAGLAATETISTQQGILLAALALISLVLLATRWPRRRLDGSPKQYRREIDSATAQSESVKRDMEQLLTELEDLSRRINGQIDASLAKLRETTEEADRRISSLRILIAESKRRAGETGAAPPPADAPQQASMSAEVVGGATVEPTPPEPQLTSLPPASPAGPEQRHQHIYELADQGLTPVEIAQKLQAQPGEIELILNLRKVES
ncbi:MAG TPA: hypothetical protein VMV94_00405 [Phycisphaerae bacterium]|nr:hypothetical protein [Phycisphaerae bacterium]